MRIFRGFRHPGVAAACALTIGNFDGVHRGHQAMLALLRDEARQRGLPTCVLTFEPHPRDYFAGVAKRPELAPARVSTLRDKLAQLAEAGVDQTIVLPFDGRLAAQTPEQFIRRVLLEGLGTRYLLVGDDFRFGAKRAGDYAMLAAAGAGLGFEVARMRSYSLDAPQARLEGTDGRSAEETQDDSPHGLRVSSSAVREALAQGRMRDAQALLGHPYRISGHVVHGRKLGRALGASQPGGSDGFRTLNLRFSHWKPAASGIFAVLVHGLTEPPPGRPKAASAPSGGSEARAAASVGVCGPPLRGVANLGVRPSLDANDVNAGRVLLETHCLDWPEALGAEGAYGKIVRVELMHKLHDELRYTSLEALTAGIAKDRQDALAFFASTRQVTRDRI